MGRKKQSTAPKRQIAPRLANGEKRVSMSIRLPEYIKRGFQMRVYAASVNRSMSYQSELDIIERYGFKPPEYLEAKPKDKKKR